MCHLTGESRYLSNSIFSFPLYIFPEAGLLNHTIVLFSIFWGNFMLFSLLVTIIYIPKMHKGREESRVLCFPSRRGLTPGWVWNATPRFLSPLDMNIRSCTQALVGSLLPSVTRAHLQLFLESRMEDKTFVGQHKRKHEFPVVTQISHRN